MPFSDLALRRAVRHFVIGLAAGAVLLFALPAFRGPDGLLPPSLALAPSLQSTPAARSTSAPDSTPTARPGCALYPSLDVPGDIPDNDPLGLLSVIRVPLPGRPLTRVSVRIDELRHPYVGDLRMRLLAPDGTTVLLLDRIGNDGDDFYRTVLHDAATVPIHRGLDPYTGSYRPDQPLEALSGLGSAGRWQLRVADMAGGDEGTLVAWSLELCTVGR